MAPKSYQPLSPKRRIAVLAFIAPVSLAFIVVFWLAIFLADDPMPWILGLVIVGGVLNLAGVAFLWAVIVDTYIWLDDTELVRKICSQLPAVELIHEAAPRFEFQLRVLFAALSIIQIIVASVVAFVL